MPDAGADKLFVSDITALEEGDDVQSIFLARSKEIRTTSNDNPFLCVTLGDRTGTIEGRGWTEAELFAERFEVDEFVRVQAKIDSYQDEFQLNISDLQSVPEAQLDIQDFLPHSRWAAEEMFQQLVQLIDRHVRSDAVRRFLGELFKRDAFVDAFKRAPAAKANHHEYFGGLLEHCLSMARLGVRLSQHYARYYPDAADQDLIVAGCVLHDIGKIEELSYERSVDYSTDGKMIGHITQGVELVTSVVQTMEPPLDDDLIRHLKHLVLSHHGHREYGSPVEPRTPEAMLLHHIDMIDSRMNSMHSHLEEHRDGAQGDDDWTAYHGTLERSLYAGPSERPDWAHPPDADDADLEGPGKPPSQRERDASNEDGAPDDAEPDHDHSTLDMFGD